MYIVVYYGRDHYGTSYNGVSLITENIKEARRFCEDNGFTGAKIFKVGELVEAYNSKRPVEPMIP